MNATSTSGAQRRGTARTRLLEAAARRFYDDGIAATGIDTITADAGVAKMSLYNNFASKAALVEAYLTARDQEWLQLYEARSEAAAGPQERILAVFDAYADHAALAYDHGFRGCGLLNAAAELPTGDPGRETVRRHKEHVEEILRRELVQIVDTARGKVLASHLAYLLEGSMARAGLEGSPDHLSDARQIAHDLIDAL